MAVTCFTSHHPKRTSSVYLVGRHFTFYCLNHDVGAYTIDLEETCATNTETTRGTGMN